MAPDRPTVLIVEDTRDIGTMLVCALTHYGARSTIVSTGTAALQALATTAYTVLLTDYDLPDITGVQLIAHSQATTDPPCSILMSGHSQSSLAPQLTSLSIVAFLPKPFTLHTLFATLDTCDPFVRLAQTP